MKKKTTFQKLENLIVFSLTFFITLIIAYVVVFKLKFVYGDAVSRSFHAFLVFYGNFPKLSSIGFVWPPIPTLVQLPLVFIKPLNIYGFVGNITSAFFLGATCVFLNKIFKNFQLPHLFRYLLLFLFFSNPMILFYGANGMSEAITIFFIVVSSYYFIRYLETGIVFLILPLSFFTALALMSRWETLALAFSFLVIFLIESLLKKETFHKFQGVFTIYITPILFTILIWVLANWLIMGDPLHFLRSIYSNTSQSALLISQSPFFSNLKGDLFLDIEYGIKRIFLLFPTFFIFILFFLFKKINNKKEGLYLLLFTFVIPLFHILLLYKGLSFGWLRFFIYTIPFGFIFIAWILKGLVKNKRAFIIKISTLFLMIISSISSFHAMSLPNIGREENSFINVLKTGVVKEKGSTFQDELPIVDWIKTRVQKREILTDDFMAFPIIYYSQNPNLFVQTTDDDFNKILDSPRGKVKYVLVTRPTGVGSLDVINRTYPGIFENGGGIGSLEKDFGDWRLYKIN